MKKLALLACALSLSSVSAFAHGDHEHKMKNMTPDQRKKMADVHEKFATCLRSDKEMSSCREEMMKGCEDAMGKDCPMHGKMEHAKGK